MIEAKIEINDADIRYIRERLGQLGDKTPTVLSRAINRTVNSIKTEMKRETAKKYNILKRDVVATLDERKATSKELFGYVKSTGAVIPLSKFKVSPQRLVSYDDGEPNPSYYSAAVFKGGTLKALNHSPKAFIAVMSNGHGGVYERTGRWESKYHSKQTRESKKSPGEKKHSKHNEIIRELFGPSVPHMIKNEYIISEIKSKAQSTLQKRIDAEINYILSKG